MVKGTAEAVLKAEVALLHDDDGQSGGMLSEITDGIYKELEQELNALGIQPDIISKEQELTGYKVVFIPKLCVMKSGTPEKLKEYLGSGGIAVTAGMAGGGEEACFPMYTELFGVAVEERKFFASTECNGLIWKNGARIRTMVTNYAEKLLVKDAEVLAVYEGDSYMGGAAVVRKQFGSGAAYYIGCHVAAADLHWLFTGILTEAGVDWRYAQ